LLNQNTKPTLLLLITEDWYFWSHRLPIARAAQSVGFKVIIATRIDKHKELIEQEGFRLIPILLKRKNYNPFKEILSLLEIIQIYRSERPTIVHHVAMKPILYGSLAAWFTGITGVVNALAGLGHIFISKEPKTFIFRLIIKRIFQILLNRSNTRVIIQNPDDRQLLMSGCSLGPNKLRLINGAGVNTNEFNYVPELGGILLVILASRMLWDKGIIEFVNAAEILKKKNIQARFALVGRVDEESPSAIPISQLEKWNNAGVVEWWGHSDKMPQIFAQSHIVCLPTFYGEGIPKVLIEAAASGRPIVTTNTPGCREIVRNGVNGLLIPPKNVQALADALQFLIENPDIRREMGVRGRNIAVNEFSEEKVVKETMAVYEELLA